MPTSEIVGQPYLPDDLLELLRQFVVDLCKIWGNRGIPCGIRGNSVMETTSRLILVAHRKQLLCQCRIGAGTVLGDKLHVPLPLLLYPVRLKSGLHIVVLC